MDLRQALSLYGKEGVDNITKLKAWRDEALTLIAEGKGQELVSGSGNGVSFSVSPSTTVQTWFMALQGAITQLTKRHSSVRRVQF